ncbi:hypothetical protein [Streptomyces sp. BA2]|uniref:hypothetical protein n=1 Tax=Streptomyces sp. BA2 TaxID=436595 RepID=UPI001326C78D|nr:hypothetical protein [Streptomyces sp. BA2]MWA13285.1 hypothetical protein [Streptomyces sp. BA2]
MSVLTNRAMVIAVAGAAMLLSGCGAGGDQPDAPPGHVPVTSFVGQTVAQVEGGLPSASSMVSYDLSKPVTGAKATYGTAKDTGTHADWIVVVACADTKNLEDDTHLAAGVLRADAYTEAIAGKAKDHAFDRYLAECGK